MSKVRKEVDENKEAKRFVGGWWMWILLLVVITVVVLGGLKYMGKIGGTVVERVVFENSYQRSESLKSRENTYTAQLAGIEAQLSMETDEDTIKQLKTQRAMLNSQINATRGMK